MNDVTAIIISFLRPGYTKACVDSLQAQYPDIKIIVGENGNVTPEMTAFMQARGVKYIKLPYDSGVCVARNTLIKEVDTEFVLVGDDDFYYTPEAKVDAMARFMRNHPEFDLVGGRVSVDGIVKDYQGHIEKRTKCFVTTKIDPDTAEFATDEASGLRYCPADLTFNYFVGRTGRIKDVPWDEEIKVAYEHFTWFFDFKCAGGKVAFSPDPVVIHKPAHIREEVYGTPEHHEYMAFRNRKSDMERFFAKYAIDYTIGMNGVKTYAPNHIFVKKGNDVKFVDFCITTFKRPKALERLLFSIAENYPMANVYVADQNEKFDREFYRGLRERVYNAGLIKRVSVHYLGYDIGVSAARNWLVLNTPNKYKLILDDDFEFSKQTDIGKFVKILEAHPKVGIVGGLVKQLGSEVHFEFDLEIKDGTIYQVKDDWKWLKDSGVQHRRTGCVLNFAIFRKEVFDYIQWDEELKATEHMDFYLRMKAVPWQIMYTPEVVVEHPPVERDADYKEKRQRTEFLMKMLKKHKATRIKYLNGQIYEIEGDGIARYKEKPE